jgi:hypothetical protein
MRGYKLTFLSFITILIAIVSLDHFVNIGSAQAPINRVYGRFYQLDVVAESGQDGLTGMGDNVSLNDDGTVAFVGQTASPLPVGEGVFVRRISDAAPINITPGFQSSTRVFGRAVQINNNNQVAARDRTTGSPPPSLVRIWNADSPGSFTTVARGGFASDPFNSVLAFPSLNNNVTATSTSGALNYVFGSLANTTLADLLVTPNAIPVTTLITTRNEIFRVIQRPLIADDGKIIMRTGNLASDPIVLFNAFLGVDATIADNAFAVAPALPVFGRSPGISDDGVAVAFYADLTNLTKAQMIQTNVGPGIFISLNDGSANRKIVRVTGRQVEDVFNAGNLDGICDSNEVCINAELGVDATGRIINFADPLVNRYDKDSRVAVSHLALGAAGVEDDTFVVSFIATPNRSHEAGTFSDKKGIWTVRVDVKKLEDGSLNYEVSRPVPVIQVDDKIGNRIITDVAVHDQLAGVPKDETGAARVQHPGDHRVAFWASTLVGATAGQIVVRATQIDTDEDALYDHWETPGGGIDFDGDGLIDLPLGSAPYLANPSRKDIFVEVDSMDGLAPSDAALRQVEASFSNAPANSGPITLHLMKDTSESVPFQTNIAYSRVAGLCAADPNTSDFNQIKRDSFGTVTERASGSKVINAKALAFRYALFGYRQATGAAGGVCTSNGSSGVAGSILSDSFFVTLGFPSPAALKAYAGNNCLPGETLAVCGQREAEAGTLMHEFGHTLGLRHGGSADDNHKPNYFSLMSYNYQFKNVDPNRALDYSRETLDSLNENGGLNEPIGITDSSLPPGTQLMRMVILGDFNGLRTKRPALLGPAVDWNVNGNSTETMVTANINYVLNESPSGEAGSLKTLRGSNDWRNLKYNFRNSMSFNHTRPIVFPFHFSDGVFVPPLPELTETQVIDAASTFDADDDGINNLLDNCPGTFNPDQTDTGGDGIGDACTSQPTAAAVSVGGRVSTSDGRAISGVRVTMTHAVNGEVRTALTNAFGYFRFQAVLAGDNYILEGSHKRYKFEPRFVTVLDEIVDADLTPIP